MLSFAPEMLYADQFCYRHEVERGQADRFAWLRFCNQQWRHGNVKAVAVLE
jgi:hypothetical protein